MTPATARLLWLGAPWGTEAAHSSSAVSPAANWWNTQLVNALRSLGHQVATLAHVPERVWPAPGGSLRGSFCGSLARSSDRYVNVPFVRNRALRRGYTARASTGEVDALVTYNPYPYLNHAAIQLRRELHVPWICIFADLQEGAHGTALALERADTRVFLSWHDFERWGRAGDLHLDGGIALRDTADLGTPVPGRVLYAGALNRYGGIDSLLAALPHLPRDVTVAVAGRGATEQLRSVRDSRVQRLGFLDDAQLHREHLAAEVFVNPRPADEASNSNFPSKILRYLEYQRPVVSTRTAGLSPDYEEALVLVQPNDPRALAGGIIRAFELSKEPWYIRDVREFGRGRSWQVQAERFSAVVNAGQQARG